MKDASDDDTSAGAGVAVFEPLSVGHLAPDLDPPTARPSLHRDVFNDFEAEVGRILRA
jgi:hypothetical protein